MDRFGFPIDESETLVAKTARDFAARRLAPGAAERDRSARFPIEQVRELARARAARDEGSAADGGAGTDNIGYVLAMEAIAEACASTAVILASSNLAAKILSDHASPAQSERWLAPYARGELGPASFALTEPLGGSDAAATRTTRARRRRRVGPRR